MIQLGLVEDGGRFGNTGQIKRLDKRIKREDLLLRQLTLGTPAQQSNVVENGIGQITLCLQVLIAGVAVALGHLVLRVPHDGGAVDIGGYLPAESVVKKVVLGRGGQILAAAYHMGDAHQVVVDHIGKVVSGQTVPFQQYLVIQGAVFHGDIAEHGIVKRGGALLGDALADDVRLARLRAAQRVLQRQITAGIIGAVKIAGVLLGGTLLAETVIGAALFRQQASVFAVGIPTLGLDIGSHGTADVGALVMVQMALGHGAVDDVGSSLHQPPLVGILDTEDKRAAMTAGNEPGIQGGTQIADVHITGRGGRKAGADLARGDLGFHLGKISGVRHRGGPPLLDKNTIIVYWFYGKSQCLQTISQNVQMFGMFLAICGEIWYNDREAAMIHGSPFRFTRRKARL